MRKTCECVHFYALLKKKKNEQLKGFNKKKELESEVEVEEQDGLNIAFKCKRK